MKRSSKKALKVLRGGGSSTQPPQPNTATAPCARGVYERDAPVAGTRCFTVIDSCGECVLEVTIPRGRDASPAIRWMKAHLAESDPEAKAPGLRLEP
jgi:hypothetical protein